MKHSKRKSARQLETEAAAKAAEWQAASRKQGEAVALTFVRQIRLAFDCDAAHAEKIFEAAVAAGEIERVRTNGAGVSFYRMKK